MSGCTPVFALSLRGTIAAVCGSLQPSVEMCGDSREQAMRWLTKLEIDTGFNADASDWPRR